jgi:hypothetical protein
MLVNFPIWVVVDNTEGKPFLHKGKYYTIPPGWRIAATPEGDQPAGAGASPVECRQPIQSGSDRAVPGVCGRD